METQNPNEVIVNVCPVCSRATPPWDEVGEAQARVQANTCEPCRNTIRLKRWANLAPPAFQETQFSLLPDQKRAKVALQWVYGPRGILMLGPTRTGKSRTAWLLLRELMVTHGYHADHVDTRRLSRAVLSYGREDEALSIVDRWTSVDVLLLDDVFKSKLTDRIEEQLFIVIDERIQKRLPMIVTTNDTEESLLSRLTADRGPALVARLTESCQPIYFEAP